MSKTETNVNNLKINRGTYANIQANLSSIGENELIITTDKNIPIPTSNDAGKVVKIDNSGEYILGTIDLSSKQDTLTTTSVSSGTLSQAIGFDSSNNLVRGNIIASGVLPITTAPVADNTSGDYKLVILNTEPANYYNGYIYIIIPVSSYTLTINNGWTTGLTYDAPTYIKLNSAPSSANDYDYVTTPTGINDSGFEDSEGNTVTTPIVINNVSKIYAWGSYADILDSGGTSLATCGATYDLAGEYTLSADTTVLINDGCNDDL